MWPFKPKHSKREIFSFWDGMRTRKADPVVLYRGMATHPEYNLERDVPATADGDPAAHRLTVQVVREVFGVKPWTEGEDGLTERETVDLLWQFNDYLESLKKSTSPNPTLRPATEPPSSDQGSPTSAESDSGSTSAEAKSDSPTESSVLSAAP